MLATIPYTVENKPELYTSQITFIMSACYNWTPQKVMDELASRAHCSFSLTDNGDNKYTAKCHPLNLLELAAEIYTIN